MVSCVGLVSRCYVSFARAGGWMLVSESRCTTSLLCTMALRIVLMLFGRAQVLIVTVIICVQNDFAVAEF